jgi:YhcH/YjgK/YiaL family protein
MKDLPRYAPVIPGLEEALKALAALENWDPQTVQLSGGNRFFIQEASTRSAQGATFEAHRNYLDVQCILEGEEFVGWAPLETLTTVEAYSPEKDVEFLTGAAEFVRITAGNCYVVFPEDAHMPAVHPEAPKSIKKLVIKLKV